MKKCNIESLEPYEAERRYCHTHDLAFNNKHHIIMFCPEADRELQAQCQRETDLVANARFQIGCYKAGGGIDREIMSATMEALCDVIEPRENKS